MFLKIKNQLINLALVTNIQIRKEEQYVTFSFAEINDYIKVGVTSADPIQISKKEFSKIINFLEEGEYEECSSTIDILKPLS